MTNIRKLKIYFAHPLSKWGSGGERTIIRILESMGLEVVNPFTGELAILRKYGLNHGRYYKNPLYKLGIELWTKDLKQIEKCDILLAWIPEKCMGTPQEIAHAFRHKKFIQIITNIKHPSFAFYKNKGAQVFSSITDFKKLKQVKWD